MIEFCKGNESIDRKKKPQSKKHREKEEEEKTKPVNRGRTFSVSSRAWKKILFLLLMT